MDGYCEIHEYVSSKTQKVWDLIREVKCTQSKNEDVLARQAFDHLQNNVAQFNRLSCT